MSSSSNSIFYFLFEFMGISSCYLQYALSKPHIPVAHPFLNINSVWWDRGNDRRQVSNGLVVPNVVAIIHHLIQSSQSKDMPFKYKDMLASSRTFQHYKAKKSSPNMHRNCFRARNIWNLRNVYRCPWESTSNYIPDGGRPTYLLGRESSWHDTFVCRR